MLSDVSGQCPETYYRNCNLVFEKNISLMALCFSFACTVVYDLN